MTQIIRKMLIASRNLNSDALIEFPMNLKAFEYPLNTEGEQKTAANFRVIIVEFESEEQSTGLPSIFKRVLDRMGL